MNTLISQVVWKATPRSVITQRDIRKRSDKRTIVMSLIILSALTVYFGF